MLSGKLDKVAVLKAICAGFEETTEPAICLSGGLHLPFCVCVLPSYKQPTRRKAKQVNQLDFSETVLVQLRMSLIRSTRISMKYFISPTFFLLQLLLKVHGPLNWHFIEKNRSATCVSWPCFIDWFGNL